MRRAGSVGTKTVGASAIQILDADPNRWAIYFGSLSTGRYTLGNTANITLDNGLTIQQSTSPVKICRYDAGDWVCKPIYAIADSAGRQVGWLESTDILEPGDTPLSPTRRELH